MTHMRAVVSGAAVLTLFLAGCGGATDSTADRAGGAGAADATVLTVAQPNDGEPPAQLVTWAEEVERLSSGGLRIEFECAWRIGETDYELRTIEDVQDEKVDLAWVGARAFDQAGVTSFQPLLAPFLVDSHDFQAALFEAGIPQEMMTGLERVDLAGVGVFPGPMRKMLGTSKPFLAPSDFEGAVVGLQASALAERTLGTLGATARPVPSGADLTGLDGYEQQLSSIAGNRYAVDGSAHVTANINLWPRPLVLFGRDDVASAEQLDVLRSAASNMRDQTVEDSRQEDVQAAVGLCAGGTTFAVSTPEDLAVLREAVQPVYDELASDDATREHLEAITALKRDVAVPPDAAVCEESGSEAAGGDFPEGTFVSTREAADFEEFCDGAIPPRSEEVEATFEDGTVEAFVIVGEDREPGFVGIYEVFRDRITMTDSVGAVTARWSFEGGTLTFTDVGPGCGDAAAWSATPFVLSEGDAQP